MKLPKNYIIEDPYKALVDGDMGSDFRNAVDGVTGGDYVMLVVGKSEDADDSVERVRKAIGEETAEGKLKNYAILTDRPAEWNAQFISNNVIDVRGKTSRQIADEIAWVFNGYDGRAKSPDEKTFFTSDSHFFHKNIIGYCDRPWNSGRDGDGKLVVTDEDVEKMNETMIELWNDTVGKDDVVWHLGDFCLGKKENFDFLFPVEERDAAGNPVRRSSRLNGKINLVLGNHDRRSYSFYSGMPFHRVYDVPVVLNDFIILSHAPLNFVKAPFFNVFGHVHSTKTFRTFSENGCCVCVERHGYRPISLADIKREYSKLVKED